MKAALNTAPQVMGIINLTPDSFYEGSRMLDATLVLQKVEKMIREGADMIDLGAYSSRPGASHVSAEEEMARLAKPLKELRKTFPELYISVDTFRSEIASWALDEGVEAINDISAGDLDPLMLQVIAKSQANYIMMHMRGTPQTMQEHTQYRELLPELKAYFIERIIKLRDAGHRSDIIIDPGFGFSKTLEQNYEILANLNELQIDDIQLLAGISRKSMIYKTLHINQEEALNGSTALHMAALLQGANILRVHDVKEAKECINLFMAIQKAQKKA